MNWRQKLSSNIILRNILASFGERSGYSKEPGGFAPYPFEGIGKPEPLKGQHKGLWSRRITDEHRLVYAVKDKQLHILAAKMKFSTCLLSFVIFFFSIKADGQEKYSFNAILNLKAINKTFVRKSKEDTTWRTYLGKITDSKRRPLYYVIKEFSKSKAAATWHGHSNVYFFNAKKGPIARFDVALPENLPVRLQNNAIYFPDSNNVSKVYAVKISCPLPKIICIRPGWCDEVEFVRPNNH